MAVVGEAHIIVRALTDRVRDDIRGGFNNVENDGQSAGRRAGAAFSRGFTNAFGDAKVGSNLFSPNFLNSAEAARQKLAALIKLGFFLGPAFTALAGAIGSLVAVLITLVGVLGSAAQALVVLPAAIGAVIQGAVTLKLAFGGLGEAVKGALRPGTGAANDLTAALRRVEDARLALLELELSVPQVLEEARQEALRAAEAAADALLAEQRALRDYNKAQKNTLTAIERLNEARQEAKERIQQLRFETEGAAISEARARLSFERARESLQRVQDLPPNSRARQEAELAFAEADLNLRRAIDRNADLKAEEEKATAAGVEGSEQVVAAKEAIEDATQAELDSEIALTKAIRDSTRAQQAAIQASRDAQAGGRAEIEINKKIAKAREDLRRAEEDLAKARKAGAGPDPYANLSPEAEKFARFLVSIREETKKLRAAAGRNLFGNLEKAVQNFVDRLFPRLIPLLEGTGQVLGDIALQFSETATSAENLSRLETIWKNNDSALRNLGTAGTNFYEVLLALLEAAGPLLERFSLWLVTLTDTWKATYATEEGVARLTDTFNKAGDTAASLGGFFRNLKDIFFELIEIIMAPGGAGESMLTFLNDSTAGILAFLEAGSPEGGDGSLVTLFRDATDNGILLLQIIGDIIEELIFLGASENFTDFLTSIRDAVTNFRDMGQTLDETLPAFGDFLEEFSRLSNILTESGSINTFFTILTGALRFVNNVFENDVAMSILGFLAQVKAVSLAFGVITNTAKFFGLASIGSFLNAGQKVQNFGEKVGLATVKLTDYVKAGSVGDKALGKAFDFGAKLSANAGKLLKIGGIVAIIVGLFVALYQNNEDFRAAVDKLFEALSPILTILGEAFAKIFEALGPLLDALMPIVDIIVEVLIVAVEALALVIEALMPIVEKVVQYTVEHIEMIIGVVTAVARVFSLLAEFIYNAIRDYVNGIISAVTVVVRVINTAISAIVTGFNAVLSAWNALTAGLTFEAPDWVPGIGGRSFSVPRATLISAPYQIPIPTFSLPPFRKPSGGSVGGSALQAMAKGGIVLPTPGGTIALLAEAGRAERVEPLDSDGLSARDKAMIDYLSPNRGRGITINVHPSQGMDERELASLVSRQLAFQMRKGAA